MYFFDKTILLLIPAVLLAIYAQAKVRGAYARYSRVATRGGATGADVARDVAQKYGLDVQVEPIPGEMTDHYDPRTRAIRLSEGVYYGTSIAALGIAAHEAGHAVQDARAYAPLHLRNAIVPAASLGSQLAGPLFFVGILFAGSGGGPFGFLLMNVGIALYAGAVLFTLLTLPVEFNASRRAVAVLEERGYLTDEELTGAREVLSAAALTYVAATAMAVMNLLQLLLLRGRRN